MAIRKVIFNVSASGVTPANYQWGGVQGEDNATEVVFQIQEDFIALINEGGGDIKYRIDFYSSLAGYQPSGNLNLSENILTRSIPKIITQYGAETICTLNITRLYETEVEEEILSLPVTLFFTVNEKNDSKVLTNLSAFEENILKSVQEAKGYSVNAESTLNIIEEKLASGEFKGDKGDAYVLTSTDIEEIANIVKEDFVDVSEVAQ